MRSEWLIEPNLLFSAHFLYPLFSLVLCLISRLQAAMKAAPSGVYSSPFPLHMTVERKWGGFKVRSSTFLPLNLQSWLAVLNGLVSPVVCLCRRVRLICGYQVVKTVVLLLFKLLNFFHMDNRYFCSYVERTQMQAETGMQIVCLLLRNLNSNRKHKNVQCNSSSKNKKNSPPKNRHSSKKKPNQNC